MNTNTDNQDFLINLKSMLDDAFSRENSALIEKGIVDSVYLMNVYQYFQSNKEELKKHDIEIPDCDSWVAELTLLKYRVNFSLKKVSTLGISIASEQETYAGNNSYKV